MAGCGQRFPGSCFQFLLFQAALLQIGLMQVGGPLVAEEPASPAEQALQDLQGTWRIETLEIGGQIVAAEGGQERTLIIEGNKMRQGEVRLAFEIESTTSPPLIDVEVLNDDAGVRFEGIYQQEGEQLTICLNVTPDAKSRPAEFASPADSMLALVKLKRIAARP
ncbi:TIGR03067 domain-containing protein [Lignipirellula cremea]|uniref:TIGR03067 domain-containing protein n=1 Tax=Lignipirellula cremea TaxID=2528010 RepID=A0A518E289_9BACT|nr:TIGR03067 domain-containing protein [Lignipirellula cremea]QDU98183.1 hypothetical protein Pla8534_60440 [Lignipirellula cremea]